MLAAWEKSENNATSIKTTVALRVPRVNPTARTGNANPIGAISRDKGQLTSPFFQKSQ